MFPMLTWILTGSLAGAAHVFAGPDHLAAIAPLAAHGRGRRWLTGLMWGVGHSGGVWLLAGIALLAREALPIDALSTWSERLVGFVLIGIGLWGLRKAATTRVHTHEHEHDGMRHAHIHVHDQAPGAAHHHHEPHRHTHGALAVGALHGLAGASHMVGVLPSLLIPARAEAAAYVVSFGLGSIAAMTLFAWVMGLVADRFRRSQRAYQGMLVGCCSVAILVGCFWVYQGFVASEPHA